MLSLLRDYILEEVNSADFIAIQADETTDVSTYCQLMLVLRYIDAKSVTQANRSARPSGCAQTPQSFYNTVELPQGWGLCEVAGFVRMLEDEAFCFFLALFHKIMPHVDMLFNQLQKRNINPVFIKALV
ncbi:hypothetical protein NQZ68_024327 [Dissostichus eleginoides]|nr:hypothetical protein NQZ68_024327 [Dissostichus eleginoides]